MNAIGAKPRSATLAAKALKLAKFDLNAIGAKPRSAALAAKALKLASGEAEG